MYEVLGCFMERVTAECREREKERKRMDGERERERERVALCVFIFISLPMTTLDEYNSCVGKEERRGEKRREEERGMIQCRGGEEYQGCFNCDPDLDPERKAKRERESELRESGQQKKETK